MTIHTYIPVSSFYTQVAHICGQLLLYLSGNHKPHKSCIWPPKCTEMFCNSRFSVMRTSGLGATHKKIYFGRPQQQKLHYAVMTQMQGNTEMQEVVAWQILCGSFLQLAPSVALPTAPKIGLLDRWCVITHFLFRHSKYSNTSGKHMFSTPSFISLWLLLAQITVAIYPQVDCTCHFSSPVDRTYYKAPINLNKSIQWI